MEFVCKIVSVWFVLTVFYSADGQSSGNIEERLRTLEEKHVERDHGIQKLKNMAEARDHEIQSLKNMVGARDHEIQMLKNMVEALYQSKSLDKKFKADNEAITENVSLGISPNESISDEFDEPSVSRDIGNQAGQGRLQRALPETVAFYVYLSRSVCLNNHETVVFDREVTDVSGSYNIHDGIFDVPVTGTYMFSATVLAEYHRWITLEIVSNGRVLGAVVADSEDNDSHHSGSITIAVTLQAGDHVLLRRKTSNDDCAIYSSVNGFTSFTGWLQN